MSLVIRGVRLALGMSTLVDGLDAEVGPGEVLAVMGPSGAGKSTLLAWLCGTLHDGVQAVGSVTLEGRRIDTLPLAQRRVGILFQDDLLFPHMSVLDNLLFAVPPGRGVERIAAAEAALAKAELAGYGPRRPASLSGGQRARVSVLRALLARPQALLLDEPFSRLDAGTRARFRRFVFGQVRELGIPTVLVTHDPADVPAGARVVELAVPEGEGRDA
ncbi:ATP-binding cassette domain-containing protein [Schlegelella sp. S2-27]|uniref:ATP-binding cassette domain-containing protein n=1 Tax=Caldimonas mangrovi TaxID=2944811 RepID=A0ABT0YLN0_9BURK|nr:ATP-binding cassette domain-containing protein [Caldimonas mangrovi]MCM5679640.1 ATP-binding cassette domain-containing protein [Caldimonas mangrovi]